MIGIECYHFRFIGIDWYGSGWIRMEGDGLGSIVNIRAIKMALVGMVVIFEKIWIGMDWYQFV